MSYLPDSYKVRSGPGVSGFSPPWCDDSTLIRPTPHQEGRMLHLHGTCKTRSGPGVSGKVGEMAYPQSALGGTPETLRQRRGIKMGQKLRTPI
jgi:hypothetical protein